MASKERMSRVEPPGWWLSKAIPMLESPSVNHADVARDASAHAGRKSPWTPSAISKFVDGEGRTVALTNGISAALQIPQPFFTAPTEKAAVEMAAITKREQPHAAEAVEAFSVLDGVAAREIANAGLDGAKRRGVTSTDNGAKRGRGARAERASKGRS